MPGERYKSSIYHYIVVVVIVHSLSRVQLFATPWIIKCQAPLSSIIISWSMLKFRAIESVMLSNNFILFCLLLCLPSIFPSIRVISNKLTHSNKWPEYWSFNFSNNPSNEYSGLISFKIEWFDLLPVQGTLRSLLQHYSLKASILQCSAFFVVQLSHSYTTPGENHSFDYIGLVSKVMFLCFFICCLGLS